VQHQQISSRRFEIAAIEAFLEQLEWRRQVGEQGAPGSKLGLARTLHNDGEVVGWEGGEEGEDCREEVGRGGWGVDGLVEDVVKEDLEGVGEVGEGLVVGREIGGGGRVGCE